MSAEPINNILAAVTYSGVVPIPACLKKLSKLSSPRPNFFALSIVFGCGALVPVAFASLFFSSLDLNMVLTISSTPSFTVSNNSLPSLFLNFIFKLAVAIFISSNRGLGNNALAFPVFSNKSTVSSDAFLAFIAFSAESTVSLLSAFLTGSFDPLNNSLAALTPISIGKATTASSIAIFNLDCASVSLGFDFNASIASFTPGTSVSSGICANISESLPSSPADTSCDPTTESATLTANLAPFDFGSFIFKPLVRMPLAKNVPAIKRVRSRPI